MPGDDDPWFVALVRRAADRYVSTSITAWEFARGKLRGDPLYRTVLTECTLPSGGTLVDVGCGQGLMLALLAECEAAWRAGTWPSSWPPPAVFDRLVGIETRRRVAAIARQALGEAATIVEGDARTHAAGRLTRRALLRRASHDAGRGSGAAAGVHGRGSSTPAG